MAYDQPFHDFRKHLPLLPVLSIALAMSYQLGYFEALGADFFLLIPLSDHIAAALFALPFAIAVSVVAGLGAFGIRRMMVFAEKKDVSGFEGSDDELFEAWLKMRRESVIVIGATVLISGLLITPVGIAMAIGFAGNFVLVVVIYSGYRKEMSNDWKARFSQALVLAVLTTTFVMGNANARANLARQDDRLIEICEPPNNCGAESLVAVFSNGAITKLPDTLMYYSHDGRIKLSVPRSEDQILLFRLKSLLGAEEPS